MSEYDQLKTQLAASPGSWLITGVAGFIGSNLLEALLGLNQRVIGLDNFSTGKKQNLTQVQALVSPDQWSRFRFVEGDICDLDVCLECCRDVDYVLHQAALGSVPRSIAEPIVTHQNNVSGFLNMAVAVRDRKIKRMVFASSSAVYGDHPALPKQEHIIGRMLSPYAATKFMNELYADVFNRVFGTEWVGLRYFNVFGPRQDPEGAYAAVIPRWISALLKREPVHINGDGETSRDFCYVTNVVQANLLAATTQNPEAIQQAYNIAVGEQTSLNALFDIIQAGLQRRDPSLPIQKPVYRDFRAGDVRHSLADICKARRLLGFRPECRISQGLEAALDWYKANVV